ncbi:hypothetical protein J27TS7_56450 [Paenibacillus dendritiformis]|nr:hypothetical protein J27TS7_56450 [Paenibacillus dendritiformis]
MFREVAIGTPEAMGQARQAGGNGPHAKKQQPEASAPVACIRSAYMAGALPVRGRRRKRPVRFGRSSRNMKK